MKRLLTLLPLLSTLMALAQQTPLKRPQVEIFVETSRPADQIRHEYPYDILLVNGQGDTLRSDEVLATNGKPTVLLFWLTTCVPCRHELAAIASKYDSWKSQADFNLYAISIDFPKNSPAFFSRVKESKWPFQAFWDVNREFRLVMPGNLNGLPQSFVLDGQGNIVHHKRKYTPGDEDQLFALIKAMQ
ncbi:MAG: hypothetical protein KatS3mg030_122 [Saprospiraceae bacterium]|jgi:thiol-disulfide isomerase/thioredoxin|nr:MAG: hypothetical protein KatS3mg030_122 [Saprospiraceae bacterium]